MYQPDCIVDHQTYQSKLASIKREIEEFSECLVVDPVVDDLLISKEVAAFVDLKFKTAPAINRT